MSFAFRFAVLLLVALAANISAAESVTQVARQVDLLLSKEAPNPEVAVADDETFCVAHRSTPLVAIQRRPNSQCFHSIRRQTNACVSLSVC